MYVNPDDLADAIRTSQEAGRPTEALTVILMTMVRGVARKLRVLPDDLYAEAYFILARHLHRIDTAQRPFNFLTKLVRFAHYAIWRDETTWRQQNVSLTEAQNAV